MPRPILFLLLVPFSILSGLALWQHGYWGIIAPHLQSTAGAQVFCDLVIALTLAMAWMWQDSRASGRRFWPWLLATLLLGSFGPLGYLLTRSPHRALA